jgi:hypothetical protein
MVKRRNTVERWIAEIFPTKETNRRADLRDREIDKMVGAQKRKASDKSPHTDWRSLLKIAQETPNDRSD